MVYNVNYDELVNRINPIVFSKYLLDTGWTQYKNNRKEIRVFQKEIESFYQVTVPMEEDLIDYKEALLEACKKVANQEGRSLEQLLLYLLNPNADILKIRIEKKEVEAGAILIDDAIDVFENAKKLLGAAAQDVLKPAVIHKGRQDSMVNDFVSSCRFGQTEVGSYIVSIICPMTEVDDGEFRQLELFEEEVKDINFTRKVTSKVIKSIQQVKNRIDDGQYNLSDTSEEDEISVNFYEALMGMNLGDEGVSVEFIPEWAPSVINDEKLPSKIKLSHYYYEPIRSSCTQMRSTVKKQRNYVGRIKKLESTPDIENRKAGKISVIYLDDNNKPRTIVSRLEKQDYDKAIEAHSKGWYVEMMGESVDGKKNEIECTSFNIL